MSKTSHNLKGSWDRHDPAEESGWLVTWILSWYLPRDTVSQFLWGFSSTNFVVPVACAYFLQAFFVAISFPIEVNTIEVSTEGVTSEFLEVRYEAIEFGLSPFFHWERCAPRSHNHGDGDTSLMDLGQVGLESSLGLLSISTVS